MLLIFSHTLTSEQIKDAKETLKIENFIYMPDELQMKWSNIPASLQNIENCLEPIKEFILTNSKEGEYVLVQGDFGATYSVVTFCKNNKLIPVYSTTKRVCKESYSDNSIQKISHFSHLLFRKY